MNAHQRRLHARAIARQTPQRDVVLASFGRPIMLAATVAELPDNAGPVWIECCLAGTYLGHSSGKALDWGPELFQTLINNLHSNPSFQNGPNGVGCAPVIPWDYEHASEIARQNLSRGIPLPAEGLPSPAWSYDFQTRPGADGKPSFWVLTEFLPTALLQVRSKEYRWCSLAVAPRYVDPVTGKDQGPTVTSIALTNDPFIQGMVPLAATRNGSPITQTLDQWGPAESLEEALIGLRKIFELDDDDAPAEVLDQITKLRALIESGAVPEYLGIENVLDCMRRLLELPLLTLPADVLGGAEAAVNQLLAGGVTADSSATSNAEGSQPMGANAMNTALAAILRCKDDDQVILQAAQKTVSAADAAKEADDIVAQFKSIFDAPTNGDLIAKVTKCVADAKQLGPMLEAYNSAVSALKGNAEAEASNEAGLVAATLAHGDVTLQTKMTPWILQARKDCIDEKTGIVNDAKLAKFREDYPLEADQRALLTRRVLAGPNGTQMGGAATGYHTEVITQGANQSTNANPQVQKVADAINSQDGPNVYAKANALLCGRSPAHKALDLATQHRVAGEFTRTVLSGKVPAGFSL
jgi:hypothetical protein